MNRKTPLFRWRLCLTALAVPAMVLPAAGCGLFGSTLGYAPSLPPSGKALPPTPGDARADGLLLTVTGAPRDTDGNGRPDLIEATAYLFDERYGAPIYERGAFVVGLYGAGDAGRDDAEPLRAWRFDDARPMPARSWSGFGRCYRFRLSLLEGGGDDLGVKNAELVCRFEPADGREAMAAEASALVSMAHRRVVPSTEHTKRRGASSTLGFQP